MRQRTRRFVAPVAGLMLVVGAMMIAVILYSARKMDENIVGSQTELIDNSINARLTRSLSELRSVAWWDEAVTKSRGTTFDPAWLDLEVGVFMTRAPPRRIMILDERIGRIRIRGRAAPSPRAARRTRRGRCRGRRCAAPATLPRITTGDHRGRWKASSATAVKDAARSGGADRRPASSPR